MIQEVIAKEIERIRDDPTQHFEACSLTQAAEIVRTFDLASLIKHELLRLCLPVYHANGYPIEAIPKATLLDYFAIKEREL